jgi:hypothetical protein
MIRVRITVITILVNLVGAALIHIRMMAGLRMMIHILRMKTHIMRMLPSVKLLKLNLHLSQKNFTECATLCECDCVSMC